MFPDTDVEVNPYTLYEQVIKEHPLLNYSQELALTKAIGKGRQAQKALDRLARPGKQPSAKAFGEKAKLQGIVAAGKSAWQKLWCSNLKLVIFIAKKWRHRFLNMTFLDIIQEGQKGLARAIDKFQWRRGCRFGTYAVPWVKQAIQVALEADPFIRIPRYLSQHLQHYKEAKQNLCQDGKEPSVEEIARVLGKTPRGIRGLLKSAEKSTLSRRTPLDADGINISLEEVAVGDDTSSAAEKGELSKLIADCLALLSPEEKMIIEHRFLGQTQRTLKEIGELLGISKERVRQIQVRILKKLAQIPKLQSLVG